MYDLQKASIWKRISAFLFDMILLSIVAIGLAAVISSVVGYDTYSAELERHYTEYEEEYGIVFGLTAEAYESLTEEELANYEAAQKAMVADKEFLRVYNMTVNLTLVVTTVSILLAFLVMEFAVPMLFRNGQTLGKKVFGVGLMFTDGVKINSTSLLIRTFLGKYTIETMVPVLILLMIYFNSIGITGGLILILLLLLQTGLILATRNHSAIHDLLANTVAVDLASQMIFESEEEMLAYKKRIHAERAARRDY